jgi:CRISPR-associated endonuclease/helicase Cas3
MKDLVLHLIAAHHGRARPHFPTVEAFDPDRSLSNTDALAIETPRRFARLQRRYGRWGLAYLESLLRAADWAASAAPSAFTEETEATP